MARSGAGLRWAAGAAWVHDRGGWPWATLIVNLVGCVAIGVAARRLRVGTVAWAFVVTGVLGGFTTFSSFAVEVDQLIDAGRAGVALGYVVITMIGGYAATWIAVSRPATIVTPVLFVVAASCGALGASGRPPASHANWRALLIVNIVGSFVLGIVVDADLSRTTATVLGVAFCGSLTTFSGVALELRHQRRNESDRLRGVDGRRDVCRRGPRDVARLSRVGQAVSRMRIGITRGPRTWPMLQRTSPASSKLREAGDELLDRHLQLEAGEVRAEAAVDAEAEGGVAVLLPVDDERVGILEHVRITVGGRERQQHVVVLLHRAAVEVDVLGDHAGHRDRGVRTEELLERERHHLGIVGETLTVLRVLREVPDRRTDRRPRRVDAGDEQQEDRAADVLRGELVAVDLDLEQVAGEVVARVVDVVLHLAEDVVVEALERRRRAPRARR